MHKIEAMWFLSIHALLPLSKQEYTVTCESGVNVRRKEEKQVNSSMPYDLKHSITKV